MGKAERVHSAFASIVEEMQQWFNGAVPNTDEQFATVISGLDPDLSYVFPSGSVSAAGEFVRELRQAWGSNPNLRLHVPAGHTRVIWSTEEGVLAEAIEQQDGAKAVAQSRHARRSTFLLVPNAEAPFGLRVLRLHESIVPTGEERTLDWSLFDEAADA